MIGDVLKLLLGVLTGGAGEKVGGLVARAGELVAIAGVIGAGVVWLKANGDEVFTVITYAELALWGSIVGGLVLVIVRLVHRAPPP